MYSETENSSKSFASLVWNNDEKKNISTYFWPPWKQKFKELKKKRKEKDRFKT